MLQDYISRAMESAHYEIMEDGHYWGNIPAMPGAWAEAATLEACRRELQEVVEGWILIAIRDHDPLPVLDGLDINIRATADAG